ncbi:MAG: S-layer homology domain-containing protein [Butyricicoccus sp.]
MKKRLLSLITAAALMVGMLPAAFAGYENFTSKTTYPAGQFTDVPSTEWYAQNVQAAYEYKLVDGVNATQFKPNSNLTIAQAIKLAACLHSTYVSGSADFDKVRPWYQPYVTYALENGIINTTYADYDQPSTRAQFASIFANALPEDALTAINNIADGAIADVDMSAGYAADVYRLYRAGVLTGSNNAHDFKPNTNIRRSEVAAIVTRMAKPDLRQSFTVEAHIGMTADEVFSACVPAIFKLYAYDYKNNILGIGSGVVLSARGDAVTCGHLVNGVYRLVAEMYDGTKREVTIYSFDADADIAHIV